MGLQQTDSGYSAGFSSFEIDAAAKRALLHCHWQVNGPPFSTNYGQKAPCQTLDLLFTPISIWPQHDTSMPREKGVNGLGSIGANETSNVHLFVQDAIRRNIDQYSSSIIAIKLLLPTVSGYTIRNDIIQRRFLTCQLVEKVADFTTLRQQVPAFDFGGEEIVQRALTGAVGALLLKTLPGINVSVVKCAMASLETDVVARLSFPWITEKPLPRKRIAMVDGRPNPALSTASQGIYRAAQALGVDLVILDHAGHWARDQDVAGMRDEFIVCDLTLDAGLPDRIVEALSMSKGPIDGITTYTDSHILATAQAAEKMGLSTNPPEALELCRDKRKTREVASAGVRVLSVTGIADLKEQQLARPASPLEYPLIVKPSTGCSSDGVSKVTCETELLDAVRRNEEKFPGIASLVEPYISGPEVDANFILMDGELIWNEINDDFPSSAEIPREGKVSAGKSSPSMSFAETSTIMPSILPDSEISLLKASLTAILLKLGFQNGVYHLEARVKDSRKKYGTTKRGMELLDCVPPENNADKVSDASVFLIEINARLPGHQESFAVEYTYGIDYFALHMLMAVSPRPSAMQTADGLAFQSVIHALSHPLPESVRYPSNIVFIPAERGGTFIRAKPLPEGLMDYVPEHAVFVQEGEVIKDPEVEGKWPFVAYFLVVGKIIGAEGREQVRTIGEMVRETFSYELLASTANGVNLTTVDK